MNPRLIEVFYAIMKTGSVTGAANRLNVTQPAVTASLKQLERAIGFSLFHRAGGRLQATNEARTLFGEADRVLDAITVFERLARRLQNEMSGHLRVAAPPAFSHSLMPDVIASFLQNATDCAIDLTTQHHEQILQDLSSGAARNSLGITFGADDRPGIGTIPIGNIDVVAVVPADSDHADRTEVRTADLASLDLIGTFAGEPLGNAVEKMLEQTGTVPDYRVRVHNHSVAASLVAKQVGVAFIDLLTARYAMACYGAERLKLVRIADAQSLPVTVVYANRHPLADHAKVFVSTFREQFRAFVAGKTDAAHM